MFKWTGLNMFGYIYQGEGDITEMENSYYGVLLRFITDITEFYYGYYGTFLKDFVDSGSRPSKKARKALIFGENQEKSGQFITDITEYYGYYGNGYYGILRNITVRNISFPLYLRDASRKLWMTL